MINYKAILAIYFHEIERTKRTVFQSIVSPIISTSLYFIIFGAAIGSRIREIDGISYGMYIVPGLLMLNILTKSISNGSFSILFPKFKSDNVHSCIKNKSKIHNCLMFLLFVYTLHSFHGAIG